MCKVLLSIFHCTTLKTSLFHNNDVHYVPGLSSKHFTCIYKTTSRYTTTVYFSQMEKSMWNDEK